MDLSIIIVNWNASAFLMRCLASLESAGDRSERETEVLVIDNGSTDGGVAVIRERFKSVRLVENKVNLGFAAGCNLGIEKASGTYLLFLNPDTEVTRGAIDHMIGEIEGSPGTGAAGPMILNPDGTLQVSAFQSPNLSSELLRLFHIEFLNPARYRMGEWDRHDSRPVEILSGACLMVRRAALEQIGPFDPRFYMYTEEYDLCRRLSSAGWGLRWVPEARIVHWGGQSTGLAPREMFIELYRSKLLLIRKYRGRQAALLYKCILLFAALSRQPLSLFFWGEGGSQRSGIAAHYRALLPVLFKL